MIWICIYGFYGAISKVSTFPRPLKENNGFQRYERIWLNLDKNEEKSLPFKKNENNLYPKKKIYQKYLSK